MKSLLLVCFALLAADSLGKEILKSVKTPTQFDLDPDRLPLNMAVAEGDEVILQCAIDPQTVDQFHAQWYEYVYNSVGSPISSNEEILGHPQRDRYSIIHDDPLQYNLKISPVILSDGGTYQCLDSLASQANKRTHHLSLTVVGAQPNCTSTVRESGVVFEDSYQTNDCQLEYQGNIIPNMTWSGPGLFDQRYIATATHIWAGMQYNATRGLSGVAFAYRVNFTDYFLPQPANTAINVPEYNRTANTQPITVQWGPKNMIIVPVKQRYDVGDILTCSVDANPMAEYFWQNLRTNQVFQGDQVTVLPEWQGTNQTMRCDARNTIEGVIYAHNGFQIVDVNPITTTTESTPPTTTTPEPAVGDCKDLTGGWESNSPTTGFICIRLDLANNGALRGLLKNDTDTYWVDIVGRAQSAKFDQVGFNGIWPAEIGVSTFIGECHRCYGTEQLLVNVVSRTKGDQCGEGGAIRYTNQYTFYRSDEVICPNLPEINPNKQS
jgi:hypothetical protein